MSALSTEFISLIAEALYLEPSAFDRFFDTDQQHKLKIIKYPDLSHIPEEARKDRQGKRIIMSFCAFRVLVDVKNKVSLPMDVLERVMVP